MSMSEQQRSDFSTKFAYNKALGLTDDEAAREARASRIMKYALLIQLMLGVAVLLSAILVTSTPWFAYVHGEDRLKVMGWCILGAMALIAYLPVKAKSSLLWAVYLPISIPVIYMISI